MEIRPLRTALKEVYRRTGERTEGQTDRGINTKKELGAFRDYVNMHKNMLKYRKYSVFCCLVSEEWRINLCDSVVRHDFPLQYNKARAGILALS
jgi:hypothetical protein